MGQRLEKYKKMALRMRRDPIFDIHDLMEIEARGWGRRMRVIQSYGEPMAGLGFTGLVTPNTGPTLALPTVATTSETNIYTPSVAGASGTNAPWAIIPLGTLRAPQQYRVLATGLATGGTSTATQTFWGRLGTSATPASNALLSVHPFTWGTTTTNAMWWFESHLTIRTIGSATSGSVATAVGATNLNLSTANASVGTSGGSVSLSGGITATFDPTVQQGFVISTAATATTTTAALFSFMIAAWD